MSALRRAVARLVPSRLRKALRRTSVPQPDPRRAEMLLRAGVCETLLGRDLEGVGIFDEVLAVPSAGNDLREQALYEKSWALSRLGSAAAAAASFFFSFIISPWSFTFWHRSAS